MTFKVCKIQLFLVFLSTYFLLKLLKTEILYTIILVLLICLNFIKSDNIYKINVNQIMVLELVGV